MSWHRKRALTPLCSLFSFSVLAQKTGFGAFLFSVLCSCFLFWHRKRASFDAFLFSVLCSRFLFWHRKRALTLVCSLFCVFVFCSRSSSENRKQNGCCFTICKMGGLASGEQENTEQFVSCTNPVCLPVHLLCPAPSTQHCQHHPPPHPARTPAPASTAPPLLASPLPSAERSRDRLDLSCR